MEWNRFIFVVDSQSKYYLCNLKNGGVISIDKEKYDTMQFNDSELKLLKEEKYLLEDNSQNNDLIKQEIFNEWDKSKLLNLVLILTTNCNFKCIYCYQDSIFSSDITETNIQLLCENIQYYILDNKITNCHIELTGGEPLIVINKLKIVVSSLTNLLEKYNVSFSISLITNGYLLNPDILSYLIDKNLNRIQITLDGVESIHNSRRPLKSSKGSFDTIISNIDAIYNKNRMDLVTIRVNLDRKNVDSLPQLLEFLNKRYSDQLPHISLGRVTQIFCTESEVTKYIDAASLGDADFIDQYLKLYKFGLKLGFKLDDYYFNTGFCLSKSKHGFVIEPNGVITSCFSGVGKSLFKIGNLNNKILPKTLSLESYEFCLSNNCPFIPRCHCGCRYEAAVAFDDLNKIMCHRKIYEKINSEIIRYRYMQLENKK